MGQPYSDTSPYEVSEYSLTHRYILKFDDVCRVAAVAQLAEWSKNYYDMLKLTTTIGHLL